MGSKLRSSFEVRKQANLSFGSVRRKSHVCSGASNTNFACHSAAVAIFAISANTTFFVNLAFAGIIEKLFGRVHGISWFSFKKFAVPMLSTLAFLSRNIKPSCDVKRLLLQNIKSKNEKTMLDAFFAALRLII